MALYMGVCGYTPILIGVITPFVISRGPVIAENALGHDKNTREGVFVERC